jgi:hypothetical protein
MAAASSITITKEIKKMNDDRMTSTPSTHALAIVSLVLSLLGLVWILPLVGSLGGIITGYIARREIRVDPYRHTGDGIAQAGIILGWVGLAIILLAGCALAMLMFGVMPFRFR